MVFKFARIDSHSPYKVELPVGKHIIGRGKFLLSNGDDNKVSRSHAELEVTQDSVTLKSLHVNPCFYKKNDEKKQILTQNTTIVLENGDKIGILPETYWYELIYVQDEVENHDNNEAQNNLQEDIQTDDIHETEGNINDDQNNDKTVQEEDKIDEQMETDLINEIKTENISINQDLNEIGETGQGQGSPSLLRNLSPTQDYDLNPGPSNQANAEDNQNSPVKRPHSPQTRDLNPDDELKRVKNEPEIDKTGDNANNPGSSNQAASSDGPVNGQQPVAGQAQPPKPQIREKCMYGARCYRRNEQHKADFSHPQDPDWDDNPRQCQFGANCKRRNLRHWLDCIHPAGVHAPDPSIPGLTGRNKNKRNVSSDEELSPSKLIVTGKRARKTIQRQDFSDSESNEDPYGTDDSDDWIPPSDVTESQDYTQEWD